MVKVSDLKMSFGDQLIFDDVKFSINRKERVGLIGRNGSGKTTLFKLISGALLPDTGTISIPKDYRISYVTQSLLFSEPTVHEEACRSLPPKNREGTPKNSEGTPKNRECAFKNREGTQKNIEDTWKAEKVLTGLGFIERDLKVSPRKLSGGFQVRLNLAKALISDPDLLLLDEPNNFLDILSIRWLISFLRAWPKELMLVTHDRGFMDSVVTNTMIIHRKKIRKLSGGTEKLYKQILKEEEIYEKTRRNIEKKQKEIELFVDRFRAKARLAGLVQSRIKLLQKQKPADKLEKLRTLEFSFTAAPSLSKNLMAVDCISFSYGTGEPLHIDNLSLIITRNDRIGVIGKNGKGKTTLLRLLAGELKPLNGTILPHPSLNTGYFGQTNVDCLNPYKTIEQELLDTNPECSRKKIMDICGSMMFGADLAQKKISVLSGGEKSRTLLAKILLTPSNLLLLDEPTNHLDMESCDSLMAAIDSFPGAVVIVTHNETFLHTLVNRLIVFDHDEIILHNGSYADFLNATGWDSEKTPKVKQATSNTRPVRFKTQLSRSELRKKRAEIISEKSNTLKTFLEKIGKIESSIESLENKMTINNAALIKASENSSGETIQKLSIENHTLRSRISALYEELEKVLNEKDSMEAIFEKQLRDLEA